MSNAELSQKTREVFPALGDRGRGRAHTQRNAVPSVGPPRAAAAPATATEPSPPLRRRDSPRVGPQPSAANSAVTPTVTERPPLPLPSSREEREGGEVKCRLNKTLRPERRRTKGDPFA
ncbi:hypothetical protein ON010_g11360 [Phytophthora cinnamomi]|nr:hypothetical protein ON010_g11360 [Phytophthora cinnamomi]